MSAQAKLCMTNLSVSMTILCRRRVHMHSVQSCNLETTPLISPSNDIVIDSGNTFFAPFWISSARFVGLGKDSSNLSFMAARSVSLRFST